MQGDSGYAITKTIIDEDDTYIVDFFALLCFLKVVQFTCSAWHSRNGRHNGDILQVCVERKWWDQCCCKNNLKAVCLIARKGILSLNRSVFTESCSSKSPFNPQQFFFKCQMSELGNWWSYLCIIRKILVIGRSAVRVEADRNPYIAWYYFFLAISAGVRDLS